MNMLITVLVIAAVILAVIGKSKPRRRRAERREPKDRAFRYPVRAPIPHVSGKLNELLKLGTDDKAAVAKSVAPYRDKFRLLNNTESDEKPDRKRLYQFATSLCVSKLVTGDS